MANITLAVSEELKHDMQDFPWVTWSEAARELLLEGLRRQEAWKEFDGLLKDSKLTDEDCEEFGNKLKSWVWESIKKEGRVE